MPRVAELKMIDGAIWARVEMDMGGAIEMLSADEIEAARQKVHRLLDKIDSLTVEANTFRSALEAIVHYNDKNSWSPDGAAACGEIARTALMGS